MVSAYYFFLHNALSCDFEVVPERSNLKNGEKRNFVDPKRLFSFCRSVTLTANEAEST